METAKAFIKSRIYWTIIILGILVGLSGCGMTTNYAEVKDACVRMHQPNWYQRNVRGQLPQCAETAPVKDQAPQITWDKVTDKASSLLMGKLF